MYCSFAWNWDFFPVLELWESLHDVLGLPEFWTWCSRSPGKVEQNYLGHEGTRKQSRRPDLPSLSLLCPQLVPKPAQYYLPGAVWKSGVGGLERAWLSSDGEGTAGFLMAGTWLVDILHCMGEPCTQKNCLKPTHHRCKILDFYHPQKETSYLLAVNPIPLQSPRQPPIYCLTLLMCLFWKFHINEIIKYVVFCGRLLSLQVHHVVACVST